MASNQKPPQRPRKQDKRRVAFEWFKAVGAWLSAVMTFVRLLMD